jgi:hypothetical protein
MGQSWRGFDLTVSGARREPWRAGVEVEDYRGQTDRADYSDDVSRFHFTFPFAVDDPCANRPFCQYYPGSPAFPQIFCEIELPVLAQGLELHRKMARLPTGDKHPINGVEKPRDQRVNGTAVTSKPHWE